MSQTPSKSSGRFSQHVESGTPELARHHRIEIESVDHRGLMRRARVIDQHPLDEMLISRHISSSQHAAGESMMDLLALACGPRSPSLEPMVIVAMRSGDATLVGRWLAISSPVESLLRHSPDSIPVIMGLLANRKPVALKTLSLCRRGLDVLSGHFGTWEVRDPRRPLGRAAKL